MGLKTKLILAKDTTAESKSLSLLDQTCNSQTAELTQPYISADIHTLKRQEIND